MNCILQIKKKITVLFSIFIFIFKEFEILKATFN